jgi:hypothetical protein
MNDSVCHARTFPVRTACFGTPCGLYRTGTACVAGIQIDHEQILLVEAMDSR